MPIPADGVIADLRSGPGISNPGEATVNNIGFKNGAQIASLVQSIPANPTSDPTKWTRLWFTDPKLGITKADLFRLWPGKTTFESELYGQLPVPRPQNIKLRWTRVYFDARPDDSTAETQLVVGTLNRWCSVNMSRTGMDGSGAETEFLMAIEIWSDAMSIWSVDTRILKPENPLKVAAGRLDIG